MAESPPTILHWWTAAFPGIREPEDVLDQFGGTWSDREFSGGFNQPMAFTHETGARVHFGSENSRQPIVLNATGQTCEVLGVQLAEATDRLGGHCTRCDVARDLEPAGEARRRLRAMHRAFLSGRCETRISKCEPHGPTFSVKPDGTRNDEGMTVYFGSKDSPVRLAAYDRRGPLRVEWRCRPKDVGADLATQVPKLMALRGVGAIWQSLARKCVFPFPWYRQLLNDAPQLVAPTAGPPPDFNRAMQQIQEQWGQTLYLLDKCGVVLADLVRAPAKITGAFFARAHAIAEGAEAAGYDGEALRWQIHDLETRQRASDRRRREVRAKLQAVKS